MSTDEDEINEEEGGPLAAFIHLSFWLDSADEEGDEEPIREHQGFDIPIPDVGDRVDLVEFELLDEESDDDLSESHDEEMPGHIAGRKGPYEVVDIHYTYADIDTPDMEDWLNPPYVIVVVNVKEEKEDDDAD